MVVGRTNYLFQLSETLQSFASWFLFLPCWSSSPEHIKRCYTLPVYFTYNFDSYAATVGQHKNKHIFFKSKKFSEIKITPPATTRGGGLELFYQEYTRFIATRRGCKGDVDELQGDVKNGGFLWSRSHPALPATWDHAHCVPSGLVRSNVSHAGSMDWLMEYQDGSDGKSSGKEVRDSLEGWAPHRCKRQWCSSYPVQDIRMRPKQRRPAT